MKLAALLGPEIEASAECLDLDIAGVTADSRKAAPGVLYVAIPGVKADGAQFIDDAVQRGAAAVLVTRGTPVPGLRVPVLQTGNARRALALVAARFYREQPTVTVAVTGTSGKTSTADFTRQIFATLGHQAASLGTLGLIKPHAAVYGALTTPDPAGLHETLAGLAAEGITHLAFEASSHGLDQHRLDGVRLSAAAFTNLGRDHLDYHPTVEAYLAAKLRLFDELLQPGQPAVINADGAMAERVIAAAERRGLRVMTVGVGGRDLKLTGHRAQGFLQALDIEHGSRRYQVKLPLIGRYQVENALVAAGLAIATGESADPVIAALGTLRGVKGRLEIIGEAGGGLAVVDYAHKPEALAAALDGVRPFVTGKLTCVFGCGGDRDRGKRPIMGAIAAEKADLVIVTDDNPRTERPEAIRAEIMKAATGAREIGNRAEAIHAAIATMAQGDVVIVAGKGHETGQIIGNETIPFSDHEVVARALQERSSE